MLPGEHRTDFGWSAVQIAHASYLLLLQSYCNDNLAMVDNDEHMRTNGLVDGS